MQQNKITFLFGAGAVENAWAPVIKAIKNTTNRDINEQNANSFFAQQIYLARFYSRITHPEAKISLQHAISNLSVLKREICKELYEAQQKKEIKARKETIDIIETFSNFPYSNDCFISTNWDTTIEDEISKFYSKKISCLHIHGDINSDIYLPTEITTESYRNQHEEINFGRKHSSLINCLENSNALIIYGLSMSPLDAELLQTIGAIPENNIIEIIIINPNHKSVADNLMAIIDSKNVSIKGYCPSNLEVLYTYK